MSTAVAIATQTTTPPARALVTLLDDLGALIARLPAAVYRAPFEGRVSGTIGEHVRHCLDHVSALVTSAPSAVLSYDHRRRGTSVEADPNAALQQILHLKAALDRWPARSLDDPVRVRSMIAADGQAVTGWSTLGRELAFVVSHTIHHHATIGVLLMLHGLAVPDRFGHSPSTPRRN
jgi:uncharacterized damage-inducible protein DinB